MTLSMYSYNKNILEYGQIARSGPKCMIPYNEGHSSSMYTYGVVKKWCD